MKIQLKNAKWLQQVILRQAAAFFAAKLGLRRGTVLIECVAGLRRNEKCRGMASRWDDEKNSYHIKLERTLKPQALVNCLAHEMIHVRQWDSGKMEDVDHDRHRVRWGTKFYYGSMAYTRHPWEIQAYRYAPLLVRSWKKLFR